ncbi:sulfite exporter TauE/SafE family protein [Marinicrinis lubricantis]|uniref:Probable membrane transporter protein n=1 Tax=Marinicrinis lubricantis TaxID=2086470 RepID=A0ABW1IUD9_9BACL
MRKLIIFSIIGFFAQLIDGSLGMAYGATSSSLLLMFGVAPAVASASIHIAEIATTAASGVSHLYFKNVDRSILLRLTIPGAVSAFIGAAFLSHLPGEVIRPFISIFLLLLGVYIVYRFMFRERKLSSKQPAGVSSRFLTPLGFIGGFFDAVGGGGWGPITTPMLLAKKGMTPRRVIGTVDTSEFVIAVSATLGFILFLGWGQFHWVWVFAFMGGGILAAPLAAWLVKIIPSYLLGVLVGGFIILTNANTIIQASEFIPSSWIPYMYAVLLTLWTIAIIYQFRHRPRSSVHAEPLPTPAVHSKQAVE